jgi:transcriptional regulator GlxA family with amidase domain
VDPRIERAVERIERDLHLRLTVADLAETAQLSVPQFTRLFRVATGRTPIAFLRERRLVRARLLVERTSLSIEEVMMQVGVADRSRFARDFRRAHGHSPRTLRLQLRGNPPRQPQPC